MSADSIARRWLGPKLLALLLASAVGLATAPSADAALFDYTATLEMDIGTTSAFTLNAGGQISVNPDGSFTFPAGVFSTSRTLIPLQTPEEVIASIELQMANEMGTFGGPMSPGGTMRLTGQVILNFQPGLSFPALTLGISPLGAAGNQTATAMSANESFAVTETLTGAPWQTGRFQQTGFTVSGSMFATRTNIGVDQRTPSGEGIVTLVVPAFVTTRVDGSFQESSPISAVLSITFVPEPALFVGQSTIIAVLVLLGWRRLHRRRAGAEDHTV